MATSTVVFAKQNIKEKSASKQHSRRDNLLSVFVVFCTALAVAILYHSVFGHPKITLMYDGRGYLSTTQKITQFLIEFVHGRVDSGLLASPDFLRAITTDGPVFPSFFGVIFFCLGRIPTQADWQLTEIVHSVVHAISAVLVFLISKQILQAYLQETTEPAGPKTHKLVPMLSGIAWGIYPAAVINTGRFCTETLLVGLMLIALLAVVSKGRDALRTIVFGIASGLVILMKPAMVLSAVLSLPVLIFTARNKIVALVLAVAATALTILPWSLYTNAYLGHPYISTSRNASYNMAMGVDTEVGGTVVSPYPPLTEMFMFDSDAVYFMASQWKYRTQECMSMTLSKVSREFSHLWNDYSNIYFGLNYQGQRVWHLLLLFGGISGTLLAAIRFKLNRNAAGFLVCCTYLAAPILYLLFEGNPRYGFTVIPLCTILSTLSVATLLLELTQKRMQPRTLAVFVLAATSCFAILGGDIIRATKTEVTHPVTRGTTLERTISLPQMKQEAGNYNVLLLVDGSPQIETATVKVNGRYIDEKLLPLRDFVPTKYAEHYVIRELSSAMGTDPENFRQWRVLCLPASSLHWGAENTISLRFNSDGVIYGDLGHGHKRCPSLKYFCPPTGVMNPGEAIETRPYFDLKSASIPSRSYKIESGASVALSDDLRIYVALTHKQSDKLSPPLPVLSCNVDSSLFPVHMDPQKRNILQVNKYILQLVSPAASIKFPRPASGSKLRVSLTGSVRAAKEGSKAGLLIAFPDNYGRNYVLAKDPNYIAAGTQWKPFEISDEISLSLLPGDIIVVNLGIYPGSWLEVCGYGCSRNCPDLQVKDLKLSVTSVSKPEFDLAVKPVMLY